MIYKSEYGNINIREIGTSRRLTPGDPRGEYQHTVQVGFKGKHAQFKLGSYGKKLSVEELLESLRYFLFTGLYVDNGCEQVCINKWVIGVEEGKSDAAREEYFVDFQRTDKRRVQLERIGITIDMAWRIEKTLGFDMLWGKTEKWT